MDQPRSAPGVVELGGKLYAIGGYNSDDKINCDKNYLNSVEVLDPDTNLWSPAPPMNKRRWCPGAATLDGKIYVAGGYDGSSHAQSVEMFDPSENMWKNV